MRSRSSATTSTRTTRSRVTSAASGRRRSSACPRSARTAACGTGATCRRAASARRRTRARGRARRRPSAAARRARSNGASSQSRSDPCSHPPSRPQEHRDRPGAHQDVVQQHDRRAHRQGGQRDRVGVRRLGRVQGLAQVHAVRGAGHGRRRCAQGHGARPAEGRGLRQGPGLGSRDGDPLVAGGRAGDSRSEGRLAAGTQRRPAEEAEACVVARDRSPKCKQCRREGMKLFLKGERCLTQKGAMERRSYPPGEHGRGRIKQSEYLLQLREKQKARRYYGLLEAQFRTYYEKATRAGGVTGENLLRALETRLDNVVYRLGFAASRAQARQLVRHGHFSVNGRRVNIPSYQVRPDDIIMLKTGSSAEQIVRDATDLTAAVAPWLQADHEGLTGKVLKWPERDEIDTPVQESLIVELYSK